MKLLMLALSVTPLFLRAPEGDAGGAGGGDGGGAPPDKSNQGEQVPLSTHKEVLTKFHTANADLKKVSTELETLRSELKSMRDKSIMDSGDFKKLYEQTKTEKVELEGKYNSLKDSVVTTQRMGALETEMKKMGLKQGSESILDLADLDAMPVEFTTKGRILVQGAEEQAKKLKDRYAYAFEAPSKPNINTGGTGGDRGNRGAEDGSDIPDDQLTADYMIGLESKDEALYRKLYPRYAKVAQERHKGG